MKAFWVGVLVQLASVHSSCTFNDCDCDAGCSGDSCSYSITRGYFCSTCAAYQYKRGDVCKWCAPAPGWDCGRGFYRSGSMCHNGQSSDTQRCVLCTGGIDYDCGPGAYRAGGTVCPGTGSSNTQFCSPCKTTCPRGSFFDPATICMGTSTADRKCLTQAPTSAPTTSPTAPTLAPSTHTPSESPTHNPTRSPTHIPSQSPTTFSPTSPITTAPTPSHPSCTTGSCQGQGYCDSSQVCVCSIGWFGSHCLLTAEQWCSRQRDCSACKAVTGSLNEETGETQMCDWLAGECRSANHTHARTNTSTTCLMPAGGKGLPSGLVIIIVAAVSLACILTVGVLARYRERTSNKAIVAQAYVDLDAHQPQRGQD